MPSANKTKPGQSVTLRDIAREAGVSPSTVSRIIAKRVTSVKIGEETRRRVLEICERHRFLPNISYARLLEGRSRVIGFFFRTPESGRRTPFFDENVGWFLNSLEVELADLGYSIMLQGINEEYETNRDYLRILRNQTVDGILIWDAFKDPASLRVLSEEKCPAVAVAFPDEDTKFQVYPDNFQGAYDMTCHLLDLGHRQIAHIGGGLEQIDEQRELGYRAAMHERGLGVLLFQGTYTFESGYECAGNIIKDHPNLTAIFAGNDLMAVGCLRRFIEMGIRVPDDIALAGFDGTSYAAVANPPITTGRLPIIQMGQITAKRIVDMVEGREVEVTKTILPIEIIPRASTVGRRIEG